MRQIILASQSPRRKMLLEQVGIEFIVHAAQTEEKWNTECSITEAIEQLAYEKAKAVSSHYPQGIVIGADTMVCLDGECLGKPKSPQQAKAMLQRLSGRTHQVITGVSIMTNDVCDCFHCVSEVTFYELSEQEIDAYIASKEPLDKAGAYGIQGKGAVFVAKIVGDYYNIVGLPIAMLVRRLRAFG